MQPWRWFRAGNRILPSSPRAPRDSARRLSRLTLERLEDRLAPAVGLSYAGPGSVLSLTESVNGATNVTISDSGTNTLTINLNGGHFSASSTVTATGLAYSTPGNPTASTSATIDISTANNITTLMTNLAGDSLTFGTLADNNGGVGNINATAGTLSLLANDTLNTSNATAGKGNITLTASSSVTFNTGSTLQAKDGTITVKANLGATSAGGSFVGITDNGGTVETTGLGAIVLHGRGGTDSSSGGHIGVLIEGGGQVLSTGTGSVTITGTGGTGGQVVGGALTSQDVGVQVTDTGSVVSSVSGAISVTGTGAAGPGQLNAGVFVLNGGRIASTGTGSSAATITITGSGGSGSSGGSPNQSANYGVAIATAVNNIPAGVTSVDGAIKITGTGGSGAGDFDLGVAVLGGGLVQATGLAPITINGTGGSGANSNFGVVVWNTNGGGAQISSNTGAILLTGKGGTGTGGSNFGITVQNGGQVTATGAAVITLNGTGGKGTGGDNGVNVDSGQVTSQGGAILFTGSANVPASTSVNINGATAVVSTTGNGTLTVNASQDVNISNGATLSTVNGGLTVVANQTITPAAGNFTDLTVNGATLQTTGAGEMTLRGHGGNDTTTDGHVGVLLEGGSAVQATGQGNVTVVGTGGKGGANNSGIVVQGATVVTAVVGKVAFIGAGGDGTGSGNTGVIILGGSTITASGTLPVTGIVAITGQGGNGTDNNVGVVIENAGTAVTGTGTVNINGQGGNGTGTSDIGVEIFSGAAVSTPGNAPVLISGNGGTGGNSLGVQIDGASTAVTTAGGRIGITGSGTTGVVVTHSASISSTQGGAITFSGDSMTFDSTVTSSTSGVTTLQPVTSGTQVNLGGPNTHGVLGLSAAELNSFTTSALHIGSSTAGALTITDAIAPTGTSILALITGGTISETGAGTLSIANLRTSSVGSVSLTAANSVGNLAGQVSGGGPFAFNASNALNVGTVEGVAGITTTGGNVILTAGGLLTLGTGTGESITAPGGIVDLNTAGAVEDPSSIISAAGLRLQGTGTFSLGNNNAVPVLAGHLTGPLSYTSTSPLTIGPLLGTPGLATGNGDITLNVTGGDLRINGPIQAGTGTVDLSFSGSLVNVSSSAITAAALALRGGTAAGTAAAPINTGVGLLAATVGNGGVFISNAGNLVIDTVHQLLGVTATGGPITISTTGTLAITQPVTTATSAGNPVTLSGNGTIGLFAPLTGSAATLAGGPDNDTLTVDTTLPTALTIIGAGGANTLNFDPSGLPIYVAPGRYLVPGQQPLTWDNFTSFNHIFLNDAGSVSTFYAPDMADRATALAGLTPNERFVQVLYLDALGRAGSKSELDGWVHILTSPGGSLALVASAIEHSAEARDHLVKTWYLTYLGRAANGGEEQGWVHALLSGQTEEKVLSAFFSTQEFYNRAPTITGDGGPPSDQEYVKALYLVVFNRVPSSAELNAWVNALPSVSRAGVAYNFLTSLEGRTDIVEGIYNALLHRPSEGPGLPNWVVSGLDITSIRVGMESASTLEFYKNG